MNGTIKGTLKDLVNVLDAKATIKVWKDKKTQVYEGAVYGLYDMELDGIIEEMYFGFNTINILLK